MPMFLGSLLKLLVTYYMARIKHLILGSRKSSWVLCFHGLPGSARSRAAAQTAAFSRVRRLPGSVPRLKPGCSFLFVPFHQENAKDKKHVGVPLLYDRLGATPALLIENGLFQVCGEFLYDV